MTKAKGGSAALPVDKDLAAQLVAGLVKSGASERSAGIYIELRGLGGEAPKSLRAVSRGLSPERIRQLVNEVEGKPLRTLLSDLDVVEPIKTRLTEVIALIESLSPRSDEAIAKLLLDLRVAVQSPACLVRLADTLGCHHDLRLTAWTSRAKFVDEEHSRLAAYEDEPRRATIIGIVPNQMPELFESFINFARKFSRGAGVMAAGLLADRYSRERGIPMTQAEAVALLEPFAVHLGRHDGDDWFAFFNSANDFLRKAATRVELFGQCSFEHLCRYHERYNRSLYAGEDTRIPNEVLRAMLELAGYVFKGDTLAPRRGKDVTAGAGRGVSETQALMVKIFRKTLATTKGRKTVPRGKLVAAMISAGIRESTAHVYLGNQGIFECKKGQCRLLDEIAEQPAVPQAEPLAA